MSIAMVPLPFAASLLAGIVAVRVIVVSPKMDLPTGLISLFFALLGVQAILTGIQFGYQVELVTQIKPVLAMLIAPVAFLAFTSLNGPDANQLSKWNLLHLGPAAIMGLIIWSGLRNFFQVDVLIWASFLIYSGYFIREIRRGPDTFERFGTEGARALASARAATLCLIVVILVFDVLIYLNLQVWGGPFTQEFVFAGSILLIVMSTLMLVFPTAIPAPTGVGKSLAFATDGDRQVIEQLEDIMTTKKLYHDPNINITRVARQLNMPARAISTAVNRMRSQNFSQFVNQFRVQDACLYLRDTAMPITEIMFASGFQTKSTFNREFLAATGQSPSDYRRKATEMNI